MQITRLASILLLGVFLPGQISAQERIEPLAKYAPAVKALEAFVAREVQEKQLPALSIALVDDQQTVWAAGFGHHDPHAKTPATAETVYRVGSVSKLFTDLAVMRLVEQGKLNLDEPVTTYLPDFRPENPFGKPITLRHMMAHRSGLVREPPVGHYFDPTAPTLAATVASLNRTALVLLPGAKIKYSNAGIATVGYVLERTQKQPFAEYLRTSVLEPLGMNRSEFKPRPDLAKDFAHALMWTYHGREFPAPTFELGMAPAGSMYTTVTDLGRFLHMLFADGHGPAGQAVTKKTLDEMFTPQFAEPGAKSGFGIGFVLGELDGRRRIGHGGAIYGFATELAALPDDKLGVVVVASRDCVNAVTQHIANEALRQMLSARRGDSPPAIELSKPIDPDLAHQLAGRYRRGDIYLDLTDDNGQLFALPSRGGFRSELRTIGDQLIADDRLSFGPRLKMEGDKLRAGDAVFERVDVPKPDSPPAKWLGLIGEYGWDHDTLYILERDGKLNALIEWFYLYPLTEESPDVYKFPDFGLYHDEKIVFHRDESGRATEAVAAGVTFDRRRLDGEDGRTFRIHPERPIEELRNEALAAKPPEPRGELNKPDLVDLTTLDPTIKLDIRYATTNNFLGAPLYTSARAFLQRTAAEAVVRAHRELGKQGYGLLIHDGYRPWSVTKIFWDATPPKDHIFVADPSTGSRHNRGCAVDLTLYDRSTGQPVPMVGGYDEFSDRSYPNYFGGTSRQRWHRDLLRRMMEAQGFTVYEAEWWHFDYRDWKKYPTSNLTFEEIDKLLRERRTPASPPPKTSDKPRRRRA
jgi:CubicO group peptidase (beta-lactamase class C family)/D-alanyl-D-alanine dipeptidase